MAARALDREAFLSFRLRGVELQARRSNGWITGFGNKTRVIHHDIVMKMAKAAADHIDETTVRPKDMRSGRLKAAVANPASHRWTDSGFVFLDHEAMYGQVVYWRLIEKGTRMFVGRRRRFIFLSGKSGRRVQPNPNRRGQDTVLVGTELLSTTMGASPARGQRGPTTRMPNRPYEGLPLIRIRTPIQAHNYAQYAIAQFESGDYADYKARIMRAASESGLTLVIS